MQDADDASVLNMVIIIKLHNGRTRNKHLVAVPMRLNKKKRKGAEQKKDLRAVSAYPCKDVHIQSLSLFSLK